MCELNVGKLTPHQKKYLLDDWYNLGEKLMPLKLVIPIRMLLYSKYFQPKVAFALVIDTVFSILLLPHFINANLIFFFFCVMRYTSTVLNFTEWALLTRISWCKKKKALLLTPRTM